MAADDDDLLGVEAVDDALSLGRTAAAAVNGEDLPATPIDDLSELIEPEPEPPKPAPKTTASPTLSMEPAEPISMDEAATRLGIESLHKEQREAIEDVISGRDVLMILPTGFGKSACYQIPGMVLPKPVVLISPLLALLRDQQSKLDSRGIDCVRLDGPPVPGPVTATAATASPEAMRGSHRFFCASEP